MIRLFSHYLPSKLIVFVVIEMLVLLLVANLSMSFQVVNFNASSSTSGMTAMAGSFFALCIILVMAAMGLYEISSWGNARAFSLRFIAALVVVVAIIWMIYYFVPSLNLERGSLETGALAALTVAALLRYVFYRCGNLVSPKRRVLVLGTGSRVSRFSDCAERNKDLMIVGYVACDDSPHYVPASQILSKTPHGSLLSLVEKYAVNEIVIAIRDRRGGKVPVQDLLECRLKGVAVSELPSFFEREDRRVMLESLNPSWILLSEGFRKGYARIAVKRMFDLVASAILLVLTLPVMLLTALCIAIESGFPILYRQERVGENGRTFTIYKFRSMRADAERDGTPRWAASDDDRVTFVGRIIRKLRIDELPQIINIFTGDMSFVGPRPERPFFVDKLTKQIPYFSLRHSIKPGITGWAQVNYSYGASLDDVVEKLQYDLYYLKNHTLFLDLMILIATIEVVLWGKGAR